MEPILISPNLVYKVHCPLDLSPIAQRGALLLDTIIDEGEVEQDGGITSTGHLDAPHMWPETMMLNKWLRVKAEEVLKRVGYHYLQVVVFPLLQTYFANLDHALNLT